MKTNYDFNDVITGMAALGEIYLRITGKIYALYEENPRLRYEADILLKNAGYPSIGFDMKNLVANALSGMAMVPRGDELLLIRLGEEYMDPVLAVETASEYAKAEPNQRNEIIRRMEEMLAIFPDPELGLGDLISFGYRTGDLFPVRKEMAQELLNLDLVPVYAVFPDGEKKVLPAGSDPGSHTSMFGVLQKEWMDLYLTRQRSGQPLSFSFAQKTKSYRIYQWKEEDPDKRDFRFLPYDMLRSMGAAADISRYEKVYEGETSMETTLDDIFERFNIDRPENFTGHSLSVSDVVGFEENGLRGRSPPIWHRQTARCGNGSKERWNR